MPHIRVRGMSPNQVKALSVNLAGELGNIIKTPPENFTIEYVPSQFFVDGQSDDGHPIIETFWFERPAEIRQQAADHLTKRVKLLLPQADVAVIFQALEKIGYYENGRHF